jgi:tellurite resistance protein TerC
MSTLGWILFNIFILAMLALDLGVFHRKEHLVKVKEALIWSGVWISLALVFNLGLYLFQGPEPAMAFLTGYLIEKSLSVDNIFVFLMIFSYLKIAPIHQHKVLFWGVLGALVMRAIFITAGIQLIHNFHWIIYVFGGFLLLTGLKMAFQKDKAIDIEGNFAIKLMSRFMPFSHQYEGNHFFVHHPDVNADGSKGKKLATPLFAALVMIEVTDVIFAVDSIPAILSITSEPFIVYTSNVFAILGLRSLYFALSGAVQKFEYLKYALSAILIFVGIKMIITDFYKIPIWFSLLSVASILIVAIIASIFRNRRRERENLEHKHDTA